MKRPAAFDAGFALQTALMVVVAHAVAYFTHEFSHSFCAWALGYMANPFALDYGGATPANLVLLFGVGDNVGYDPILQGGHGLAAAVIALAGAAIGNGLLYIGLYAAVKRGWPRGPLALSFVFWLLVMCAGNVWSYVPIRAITTHADIAIAAQGLGIGVVALFPLLLAPALVLVGHFFTRVCPLLVPALAAGVPARAVVTIAVTATWFFFLFGGAGLFGNYGPVSQAFSLVSMLLLMPVALVWLWQRCMAGP